MGKTIRIDPESGERIGKKSQRKLKTAPETFGSPDFARKAKSKEPKIITEEWAIKCVAKHISCELDRIIANGVMLPSEKDHFTSFIEDYVRKSVPKYNPVHRNREGKTSSAAHYFTSCADNIVCNIVRYLMQDKRRANLVSISNDSIEEAHDAGCVSVEELSDGCRSIKELEFKMDVATLRMMLNDEERSFFDYKLEGYTCDEIAEKLKISHNRVYRTILPRVQKISRLCGFIPQSEIRASFHAKKEAV